MILEIATPRAAVRVRPLWVETGIPARARLSSVDLDESSFGTAYNCHIRSPLAR
jgi:hypothetical protein